MCVGPSKSEEEDSRFRFIFASTSFSFVVFTIIHVGLLLHFNFTEPENLRHVGLLLHFNISEPENLRLLNEVICALIFVGLMNIFLLISSKYSKLESDRSRIQIYKQMRKDFQDFVAADSANTMYNILDLFKSEPIPEKKEEKQLFNFLFSKGEAEYLDKDPLDVLELWNVNGKADKAETLLTKAVKIKSDKGKVVGKLAKIENLDINQTNSSGRTPLACAIEEENVPAVEIILSHPEVDVNRFTKFAYKKTQGMFAPLHLAILKENAEIVELLLGCEGIDVNIAPTNCVYRRGKFTPLTKAIHLKNEEIVRLLLSHPKIDVNKADPSGWTPLLQACNRGDANQHIDLLGCCRRKEDWPILNLLLQRPDLLGWDELNTKKLALKNKLRFERSALPDVEQMDEEV